MGLFQSKNQNRDLKGEAAPAVEVRGSIARSKRGGP